MTTDRTLNLRSAPRTEDGVLAVGEGQHEQAREANGSTPSHSIPSFAVDIKREILAAVYAADGGAPLTRAQIAKAVGRKKSTWLNKEIEQLVECGHLIREHGAWKNGSVMFWYRVNQ